MNTYESNPYQVAINNNPDDSLGDQMFVYAIAQLLASKNSTSVYVNSDLKNISLYKYFKNISITNSLIQNMFRVIKDDMYTPEELIKLNIEKQGFLLKGNFKSLDYFIYDDAYIKKIFEFNETIQNESVKFIDKLRTKYVGKKIISISLIENTSLDNIIKVLNLYDKKQCIYLLYTNDISSWIGKLSNILDRLDFVWMQTDKISEQILNMAIMSKCDGNIIDNSSFSLWGAFLNKNKEVATIENTKSLKYAIKNNWYILDFNNLNYENQNKKDIEIDNIIFQEDVNIENDDVKSFQNHIETYFDKTMTWQNFGLTWTITNINTSKDINESKTLNELLGKLHFNNYRPVKIPLEIIVEEENELTPNVKNKKIEIEYNREYAQNDIVDLKSEYSLSKNKKIPFTYISGNNINTLL